MSMKKRRNKKITDAVEILHRRYVGKDNRKLVELQQIRAENAVTQETHDLRTKADIS